MQRYRTMEKFDIIIIGAGAAGLMAAKIVSRAKKKVCILEARNRIGGRVHTLIKNGFSKPVEAGAEFIHGKLPVTISLLKEAGIKYYETDGELWQLKNDKLLRRNDFIEHADQLMKKLNELNHDISIAELMNTYFKDEKYSGMKKSLQQYMEGYDAADISYASSLALKKDWQKEDDEQYRIEGGYQLLLDHLKNTCLQNGCSIHLSTIVKKINWKDDYAEVITKDNNSFFSNKVIITVPLPFLTGEEIDAGISFESSLPTVSEAAKQIGYGSVIKIVLEFTHAFWETGEYRRAKNMFFLFSDEKIPTWWSQLPDKTPILTGWLAGPKANALANEDDDFILQQALLSLSSIFAIDIKILRQFLKASLIHDWMADPFSKGAYSYNTIASAAAKKILATPVANTLFFAGEALDDNSNATVEGALNSGKDVAEKMLNIL
ncbi:MAG: FAD-dependent oxidoreductase [Chitinophagaceae bacterium]|nr:FAD-dependent oxidoreductase [Chitinophagaceae bacterium]